MMAQGRMPAGSSSSTLARVGSQDQTLYWTDDLPVCHLSGVGFSTNQYYREDGFRREDHEFEDRSFHFRVENDMFLYGVFDGHDGSKVSNFAAQRIPAELLLGQLVEKYEDGEIKKVLRSAFFSVEKGYFDSIDDTLAEKAKLLLNVPEGITSYEAAQQCPGTFRHLEEIESETAGGSTAVVALIINNRLYVANVGCSRALLVKTDAEGLLRVAQLTRDHNLQNEEELQRLAELGIDVPKVLEMGKIGNQNYTRTLGDNYVKTAYKDIEVLSHARSHPVIADPELHGGIELDASCAFLILMTDGVYESLADATGTEQVNPEIAAMVAAEFAVQSTLNGVAQAVVDKIVRKHHDAYMTAAPEQKELFQVRDDITLLVRNFNYPLPNSISSPTPTGKVPFQPLSVIIPGGGAPPAKSPPNRPTFFIAATSATGTVTNTATNTGMVTLSTTMYSGSQHDNTNDSTQSEENYSSSLPSSRVSSQRTSLKLDSEGKIKPYVDFSDFFTAFDAMSEEEKEAFEAEAEPKPAYEPIPEERESGSAAGTPTTPDSKSITSSEV